MAKKSVCNQVLCDDFCLELIRVQHEADIEGGHKKADGLLCDLLVTLGYEDVVGEYRKVPKWYA